MFLAQCLETVYIRSSYARNIYAKKMLQGTFCGMLTECIIYNYVQYLFLVSILLNVPQLYIFFFLIIPL